jgi:hypothetical protein
MSVYSNRGASDCASIFLWGVKKYHPFLFEEADDILVFE